MEHKLLHGLLDLETKSHCDRVTKLSLFIAKKLSLKDVDLYNLRSIAPIHDIGKLKIPAYILFKKGKLSPQELDEVQKHSQLGFNIYSKHFGREDSTGIILQHHENWDGTGYPNKLVGKEITLLARIVAVSDVYEALVSERVYKKAWSEEDAMSFIESQSGIKFDPQIVQIMVIHRCLIKKLLKES